MACMHDLEGTSEPTACTQLPETWEAHFSGTAAATGSGWGSPCTFRCTLCQAGGCEGAISSGFTSTGSGSGGGGIPGRRSTRLWSRVTFTCLGRGRMDDGSLEVEMVNKGIVFFAQRIFFSEERCWSPRGTGGACAPSATC